MDKVRIVCNHSTCAIETYLPMGIARDISGFCSYKVEGAHFMPAVREGRWDGRIKLYHRKFRTFPSGLLERVTRYFRRENLDFEVCWEGDGVRDVGIEIQSQEYALRDYQNETVHRALEHQKCVLRIATGGGKTVIAGWVIAEVGAPTVFLVHTKDLLYQAKSFFSELFGESAVGQIGDGILEPGKVTVCTLQTASRALGVDWQEYDYEEVHWQDWWGQDEDVGVDYRRIKEILDDAGVVFMDECHRVAAPTAMDVMAALERAKYRIGLSASPWRDDGADIAIEAALGPVVMNVSASELYQKGHLVKPTITFLDVPPQHYEQSRYDAIYKRYISENPIRNAMGVLEATRMVQEGKPTLVLVRLINHGERVADLLSRSLGREVPFLSGKDDSTTRNDTIEAMRQGDLPALVATTIADEGLDIKPLQGLVLLGGGKSSVKALQRIGRTLRPYPGKDGAEIIDFMDNTRYLVHHSAERRRMYETEPEWEITD